MWIRTLAVYQTFQSLNATIPLDRISESSLSLGAAAVCIANSWSLPAKRRAWETEVFDKTSGSTGGTTADEEEWAVTFALGEQQPQGMSRGMFFVSDVVELRLGEGVFGVSRVHVVSGDHLAMVYNEASVARIRAKLRITSVVSVQDEAARKSHRKPGGISPRYDIHWTAPPPQPVVWVGLEKFQLLPTFDWQQLDSLRRDNGNTSMAGTLLDDDDLYVVLNHILHQFIHDIFYNCPEGRKHGTFVTLSNEEIYNLRPAYIQDTVLPFNAVHILAPLSDKWDTILRALFPSPGYSPPESAKIYCRCAYYHAWVGLINRLHTRSAIVTTNAMLAMVSNIAHWLPASASSAMWYSASHSEASWVTLPAGWKGTAPKVAINPLKYQPHMRAQWTLRPETREEGGANKDTRTRVPRTDLLFD